MRKSLIMTAFAVAVTALLVFGCSVCRAESGSKLSPSQQSQKAKIIYKQLSQTPNEDLDAFYKGYLKIIEQYPDTEYAQMSCWRLSNLLLLGFDPPRTKEAVEFLELFLKRYPDSDGVPQVKQRLVRLYEETGQYCKAAQLYSEVVPRIPEPPDDQGLAYWLLYAESLDKCGRKDQARTWYEKVLDHAKNPDSISAMAAKEGLDGLKK